MNLKKDHVFDVTHQYVIKDAVAQQLNNRLENDEQTRLDSIAKIESNRNKQCIIKELGLSKKTTMEKLRKEFEIRENPEFGVSSPTFRGWFKGKTVPDSSNMWRLKDFLGIKNNFDLIFTSKQSALTYEHELFFELMSIIVDYICYIENSKSLNSILSLFDNILIKKIISDLWTVMPYVSPKYSLVPKKNDNIPEEKILEIRHYIDDFLAIESYFKRIFKLDMSNNYAGNSLRFKKYNEITLWELSTIQNIALTNLCKYTQAFNVIAIKNILVPENTYYYCVYHDKLEAMDIVNKVNQYVLKEYTW